MPQAIRGTTPSPQQNFEAVQRNPQLYQGQEARFGGVVGSAVYDAKSNTTQLFLAVLPLDDIGQPNLNVQPQGIVLAYYAGYLDPVTFRGADVTVVGPIIGYQDIVKDEATYRYIQVKVNGFENWGQATMQDQTARQEAIDESNTWIAEESLYSSAGGRWHGGDRAGPQPHDAPRPLWNNASHPSTPPVNRDAPAFNGASQPAGYSGGNQHRMPPQRGGIWQHTTPAMRDGNWQHSHPQMQSGSAPHGAPPAHESSPTGSRPAPHEMPHMHSAPPPHDEHMHTAPPMHHRPPPPRK